MSEMENNEQHKDSDSKKLKRTLGTTGLVVHYITSVMGVGILIIPGHASVSAGPLSILSWLVLIFYSYPFALTFAKISINYPDSRGLTGFISRAFGKNIGDISSLYLLITLIVANPVLGIAASRYLHNIIDIPQSWHLIYTAALFMLISILFNLAGLKLSIRLQIVFLSILILSIILVGVFSLNEAQIKHLKPFAPNGFSAFGYALAICFYGFVGWENAAPVAEEVVNPKKTFPRAIFYAVSIVGSLYFLIALAVILVIPPEFSIEQKVTPFATLLFIIGGEKVTFLANVIAVVLLVLTTNSWVLGTSRVLYSTSRDKIIPRVFSKTTKINRTPYAALLTLIAGYGSVLVFLYINGYGDNELIKYSSCSFMVMFIASFFSILKLEKKRSTRIMTGGITIISVGMLPFFGDGILYSAFFLIFSIIVYSLKGKLDRVRLNISYE